MRFCVSPSCVENKPPEACQKFAAQTFDHRISKKKFKTRQQAKAKDNKVR
jgi:hypothetical protein